MNSLTRLLPVSALLLGLGLSNTAAAYDQVAGTLIGAGVGAAIGHSIDGRNGALVGGALGAVVGGNVSAGPRGYYAQPVGYAPAPAYPVAYGYPQPVTYYSPPPVAYQQVTYVQPVAVRPVVYGPPAYAVPATYGYGYGPRHGGWHRWHRDWD